MNKPSRSEEVAYKSSFVVITKLSEAAFRELSKGERPVEQVKQRLNVLVFDCAKVLYEAFRAVDGYQGYPVSAYAVTYEQSLSAGQGTINVILPKWYLDLAVRYAS
jgi:hypothetical protein